MSGELEPIRRILLALDAATHGSAALEAASALAARLDAELAGLFVEDINLVRLAALPFAREIGLASGAARRLQNPDVERGLRAQAQRAQAALAAAAGRRQLRWSFRVTRGRLVTELAGAALATDLIAFTLTAQALSVGPTLEALRGGVACPLLLLPSGALPRPPVVAVYDGTPPARRALALAARLADLDDGEVTVLVAAPDEGTRQRLRAEAVARLAELDLHVRLRALAAGGPEGIAAAARAAGAGTVVLAADGAALDAAGVRRLLARLDCAALLVRG
jgi:nucleotide-binding universal stress UspA family protein